MRLAKALFPALSVAAALPASHLSAQSLADASHRAHYETAMECAIKAQFLASVQREGRGDDLPDNSQFGNVIANNYMPILAFEGHNLGLTVDDIIADFNTQMSEYRRDTLARLNALALDRQNVEFNRIVNQVNTCARMPTLQISPE